MNRVMIHALTTSMMTPAERVAGRFMKAPDHPAGGDAGGGGGGTPNIGQTGATSDSGAGGDNLNGNSGDSGNAGAGGDNTGAALDLKGFWGNQDDAAGGGDSGAAGEESSKALGAELKTGIDNFAPPPVFTEETAKQIAEGNFDGINQIMRQSHQQVMQQSMLLTAKLVGAVVQKMQSDFDSRVQTQLGNRDNNDFLAKEFPQAKDPAFAPVVERVWSQALKNNKGDRQKAIQQTRGMLEAFGTSVAPNLRDAPQDPTAGINTPASRSLVEDLLSRG